jgi:hypothetical protein
MSLKEIGLKISYSSESDDILNDFYVPVLETSKEYLRLSGFFSSTLSEFFLSIISPCPEYFC